MKLKEDEINTQLAQLPDWKYRDNSISKSFQFKDFKQAFSVMTRVALKAENMDHHPDWSNVYNQLSVKLSTHSEGGVTEKDVEMAKYIEQVVSES